MVLTKIEILLSLLKGKNHSIFLLTPWQQQLQNFVAIKKRMHKLSASKILVVEDDPQMRESIRSLLSLFGYDVHTSMNLRYALDSLLHTTYDLVLLDLQLEDQSGFAVMDSLKEKNQDTRVIIVTGEDSEERKVQGKGWRHGSGHFSPG